MKSGAIIVWCSLAMLAFAGNSLLCRMALSVPHLDPVSFTAIRLFSGALMLGLLLLIRDHDKKNATGGYSLDFSGLSWFGGLSLSIYALLFSLAYIHVDTATGALILFATVQLSMIAYSSLMGEQLSVMEWLGFLLAMLGLVILLWPEMGTPSLLGFLFMAVSGMAWAAFTLLGKQGGDSMLLTTSSFMCASLLVIPCCLLALSIIGFPQLSVRGGLLAVGSGAITSGLGYAIWYRVLPSLRVSHAAVIQLSAPLLAAGMGFLFLDELPSLAFFFASILILLGIVLVIRQRTRSS